MRLGELCENRHRSRIFELAIVKLYATIEMTL